MERGLGFRVSCGGLGFLIPHDLQFVVGVTIEDSQPWLLLKLLMLRPPLRPVNFEFLQARLGKSIFFNFPR